MRSVAAIALQAAPALCACTMSMRSPAISWPARRALPRMRSGLKRVVGHRQPFAAEGAQFADQRPAFAGDDGARARLQQRQRDIDRGVAGRIVAQRRHQLQDGGAGERARACLAHVECAPLRSGLALRRQEGQLNLQSLAVRPNAHERIPPDISDNRIAPAARTIAVRAREGKSQRRARARLFWLGGFKSDMKGTKAQALDAWAASARPRLPALRLFRPRRIGRRLHRRHHRALARGKPRGLSRVSPRAADRRRLVHGRLDGAAAGARVARAKGRGADRRHGADRAGGRLHRGADVEDSSPPRSSARSRRKASGCGRRNIRKGPIRSPRALIEDGRKHLLLGGLIETGCPVHILQGVQDPDVPWRHASRTGRALCPRRRGADADQGRRPPAVATGGHRAADRGGGGILA